MRWIWTVLVVVGVGLVLGLFFISGESSSSVASRFMVALGKEDVATLTDLTYWPGEDREQIKAKWEDTTKYARYYTFSFKVDRSDDVGKDAASVALKVTRNPSDPGSYEENYYLPMVRKDGKWLVDLESVNRTLYPFLPR